MKFSNQLVIVAVVLIVVIAMTMWCSCSTYVPYSGKAAVLGESVYEGMAALEPANYDGQTDEKPKVSKIEGFEGLQPAPYQSEAVIDIFSGTPGSLSCKGSGLTNSMGELCLTDQQKQMLQTRGGNATGQPNSLGN